MKSHSDLLRELGINLDEALEGLMKDVVLNIPERTGEEKQPGKV